jgi:excisionase family DNA binding protein
MTDSTKIDPNKPLAMMTAGELTELLDSRIEMFFDGEPKAANDDATLDKSAVAKFLRVSPGQVDKLIKDKGLPYHRVGDVKRIFRDELIAWVKAQGSK